MVYFNPAQSFTYYSIVSFEHLWRNQGQNVQNEHAALFKEK